MQKNPENYLNSLSLAVINTDRNDKKLAEREACVIILQLLLITALNKLLGLFNSYSRMSGKLCLYPGGVLLGILGGGEPSGSPNPSPISDQKCHFPSPVFRSDL